MLIWFKYLLIFLASTIVFLLLYLIAAFAFSKLVVNGDRIPGNDITVYLLSNGVHTDIVVPVNTAHINWSKIVKYENTTGKDTTAPWVGFGWGDKGFYLQTPTWDDLTFPVAFRAVTGLSSSAIHATFHKRLVENEKCKSIRLSNGEYQRLINYILAGFKRAPSGEVIHIVTDANYGTNDAFYEGLGNYHLFHTCNTWTNNALKSAGLKASWWTPFDSGIMQHYK